MRASRLIEILASHIHDRDGGDFEVCVHLHSDRLFEDHEIERCWLYPGLRQIIIGTAKLQE